jgi:hypothetical protein
VRTAALLLLAACAGQESLPPLSVLEAAVCEIQTDSGNRATAFYLGDGKWVSCAHVLGNARYILLGDRTVHVAGAVRGTSGDLDSDWVRFETYPPVRSNLMSVDFGATPPVGSEVWVVGYGWANGTPEWRGTNCVRGVVSTTPAGHADVPGTLVLELPQGPDYHGLSGAPVIWDGRVVGVLCGKALYPTWWGATQRHLAVRPS